MMNENQLQQQIKTMRQEELIIKALNNYLAKCIQNNHRCAHCYLNHNNICFFAKECFEHDQKYYKEDEELE